MQSKLSQRAQKWVKDLSLNNFNWNRAFTQISQVCKENKLREFNFKLLHRIIVTSEELHTYGIETNSKCLYCDKPDSILHSYVECQHSQTFFNKVVVWFNNMNDSRFSPTVIEKLFGIMEQGSNDRNYPNSIIAFFSLNIFYIVRNLIKTSVTSMSLLRSCSVSFVLNLDHSIFLLILRKEKMLLPRTALHY